MLRAVLFASSAGAYCFEGERTRYRSGGFKKFIIGTACILRSDFYPVLRVLGFGNYAGYPCMTVFGNALYFYGMSRIVDRNKVYADLRAVACQFDFIAVNDKSLLIQVTTLTYTGDKPHLIRVTILTYNR